MKRKYTVLLKILQCPANIILLVAKVGHIMLVATSILSCKKKKRERLQNARLTFSSSQESSCITGLKIDQT